MSILMVTKSGTAKGLKGFARACRDLQFVEPHTEAHSSFLAQSYKSLKNTNTIRAQRLTPLP